MRATDPTTVFLINLLVGLVVGIAFDRFAGSSWLSRHVTGKARGGMVTSALVGIAGAFVAHHLVLLFGVRPTLLVLFAAAAVGAAVVLWLWRMAR
jgi:uncharacterized membrane protein YeaQ/YmgE (transglycosylase-associated protein family)